MIAEDYDEKQDERINMRQIALTQYFFSRSNLPGLTRIGTEKSREDKSTQEIIDDLADTVDLTLNDVNNFMQEGGYTMATQADGRVKWAIWRDFTIGTDFDNSEHYLN